jgi:hypothetical protein
MASNNNSTTVKRSLLEASLARILVHYENRQFGILTSWTGGGGKNWDMAAIERNNRNFEGLIKDVHDARFTHITLRGIAKEELKPDEVVGQFDRVLTESDGRRHRKVEEPSLFVINEPTEKWQGPRPTDAFRWLIIHLGLRYKQSCVILGDPEKGLDLVGLNPVIHTERHCHKIRANILAQFFSQIKPNRNIVFEAVFTPAFPKSWMEGMGRQGSGETFAAACSPERQILELLGYLWTEKS